MTCEQIDAQVFVFYVAGTESTSGTASFTLHELCQNPTFMKRAQEDVDKSLNMYNQEISYDSINDMKFIDLYVIETWRKHPAIPILNRECTKDYQIPGSSHIIRMGTSIVISLLGIHRDEKHFPQAEIFNPDRFLSSNFNSKAYMPFGEGQRNCIAYRMGILATKVALVVLLSKYKFEALEKGEIEFAANTIPLIPKHGIKLKVFLR